MHRTMLVIAATLIWPSAAAAEPIQVAATLAGHAILPAQSFVDLPPDAPVGFFRSGRFSANERLEQDYGRLERTGLAPPSRANRCKASPASRPSATAAICS